jgi:hypothetical protein
MDTQQPAEGSEPVWGAPPPQPPAQPPGAQVKQWSAGRTAAVVAVAAVVAAGGGYGISKLVGSGTADAATQGPGGGGFGAGGGGFGGRGGGMGGLFSALHGDFTVSDNGSYVTERMQTGEITAVSATSITAKSADGYTRTYVIDSSTQVDQGNEQVSAPKTGATVTIIAKLSGDDGTATSINDQQMTGGPGGQQGQGQPPQGDN